MNSNKMADNMIDDQISAAKQPNNVGYAHVVNVLQIVFLLGLATAFVITHQELEALHQDMSARYGAMDVRVTIAEKSLAELKAEDHDLSTYLRDSLDKINTALNELRTDLKMQAMKRK